MRTLSVALGERSYPIRIGEGLLDRAGSLIREALPGLSEVAVITDDRVAPLYLERVDRSLREAGFAPCTLVLPHGEQTKCLARYGECLSFLAESRVTRTGGVIALGGGVIGDLAGFAAATWLRGVRWVQLPTTLLAQVDSSVGGKTAVDLPQGKNLAGAFWQPSLVLCDPQALATLPPEIWRDGLGEVVKYGCIADEPLFRLLEESAPGGRDALMAHMEDIILRCVETKAAVVAEDERDTGARMTLNFGHTIGHAAEACEGYRGHRHGEAVAIGMAVTTRLSERRGLTEAGTAARLEALLHALGLPAALPEIPEETLIAAMGADKKAAGRQLRVVLLRRIGACFLHTADTGFFRGMAEA